MNREIRRGRWLQLRGRFKRAWARLVGNEDLAAEANADVVAGAFEESVGIAKKEAVQTVNRGVDRLAAATKRVARSLERLAGSPPSGFRLQATARGRAVFPGLF